MWQIVAVVCCDDKKNLYSLINIFNKLRTILVACHMGALWSTVYAC